MVVPGKGDTLGYIRISTVDQESGISFDTQEASIGAFCKRRGLHLIAIVREVCSGTKIHRKQLDKVVLPMIRNREITHLVVYDQDRWFRNEWGRLSLQHNFLDCNGVELEIVNEGTFERTSDRNLFRNIRGSFDQHFAEVERLRWEQW